MEFDLSIFKVWKSIESIFLLKEKRKHSSVVIYIFRAKSLEM